MSDRFPPSVRLSALVFVAVAGFHFAAVRIGGPALVWHSQTSEYYQLLTDAFLSGQTSLPVQPSPELLALPDPYDPVANANFRLHDASLYHGKYYLYFGPAPALALFLPFKVLTGSHLASRYAVALFCTAGSAFSCLLLLLVAKREQWEFPPWLGAAAVLSLGTAPAISALLARPAFYEVAIGAGYCFVMAGFLLVAHAVGSAIPRTLSLAGAGLCFGLAAGCRPHLSVVAALMVVLVAWRLRVFRARVLAFAVPVAVCGLMLAGYNYVRFHNPLDFGVNYALLGNRADLAEHFTLSLRMPLHSLGLLLFSKPERLAHSPMGLLWASPVALVGLLTPLVLSWRRIGRQLHLGSTRFTAGYIYVSGVCVLAMLTLMGFVLSRYGADFGPAFVWLSWCLLAAGWQALRGLGAGPQRAFRLAVLAAALYGALADIWICGLRAFP